MDMKKLAGDKAAEYVKDGMVVGLGTGSTAYHMVNAVGEMVKNGLKIQAIPTSKATEAQARELGIPLLTIDELDHVDLAIDGVDEIDPQFNAIKGGGGALYREKVVASMAKEVIWIMDESKHNRIPENIVQNLNVTALPRNLNRVSDCALHTRGCRIVAFCNGGIQLLCYGFQNIPVVQRHHYGLAYIVVAAD